MPRGCRPSVSLLIALLAASLATPLRAAPLDGTFVDAATQKPVAARIVIQGADGAYFFPESADPNGSAVRYERKSRFFVDSIEMHTALSAHPFRVELPAGKYSVTIERGKEYHPLVEEVVMEETPVKKTFAIRRWGNWAARGWYSGDAHTHRKPEEIATNMLAEDVNVVLPMLDWGTEFEVPPASAPRSVAGNYPAAPIAVDPLHVWYPRNTEYEITRVKQQAHTLGAFLVVNHRERFDVPAMPLGEIAARAHAEGALIDLEKHNWNWSIAIVPLLEVDLYELANNHHWQTAFGVRNWAVPAGKYMGLEGTGSETERDWTLYGFDTYYALLNCGFNIRPSAGTANGVHPVPLGFSRVYVHLDEPFSYAAWIKGLGAGRSFVTTGPLMDVRVNGEHPGVKFEMPEGKGTVKITGSIVSQGKLTAIECIVGGKLAAKLDVQNEATKGGAFETRFNAELDMELPDSSWLVLRCWEERPAGRFRFAHTAPWHLTVAGRPVRPRREEIDWLVSRVKEEIARSEGVLPAEGLAEYRKALGVYEEIGKRAR